MIETLISEFDKPKKYIESLVALSEEGNTVPFIARYRKEMTGGMNEIEIRDILGRHEYLVNLAKRKEEVIKSIDEQEKLTDELKKQILACTTLKEVEDLYAPYKNKKKTKADIARERGLEPLAHYIRDNADLSGLDEEAAKYVTDDVPTADDAITGATEILIFDIGHDLDTKNRLRELFAANARIVCEKHPDVKGRSRYENYFEFDEKILDIPPHRTMAVFRGEKEKELKLKLFIDEDTAVNAVITGAHNLGMQSNKITDKAAKSAWRRMLSVSLELEFRGELRDAAETKAIEVFAQNLKALLLTPPVNGTRVLAIDPAYRTGCKVAVVDETGRLLDHDLIHPTVPQRDIKGATRTVLQLIREHDVTAIAIGNGTGSRETEEFVAEMINENGLSIGYTIVSEAGASVYSASEVAAREFPDLDVTVRGAISIARRVIDPLAELVKIDPKSIGVGMYQHDVNQKRLAETLAAVVEDVVNSVGVNLNTASASLMQYVAGLNYSLAEKIVRFREESGRFSSREDVLKVAGIGEKVFKQCAGFLKVYGGEEPLDSLFIHPESYRAVYGILESLNLTPGKANMIKLALKGKNAAHLAGEYGLGEFTMEDIIDALERPDRDVRDAVDPVIFRKGVLDLKDLTTGMVLDGKVTNVVDFGAFVDIGLKNDGLVHVSQLANRFVKNAAEVVSVGQTVSVKVLDVDTERGRVSLSMKGF